MSKLKPMKTNTSMYGKPSKLSIVLYYKNYIKFDTIFKLFIKLNSLSLL